MTIKQRIKSLERKYRLDMSKEPWLIFEIDGEPTPEQQKAMSEAESLGRTYLCYVQPGDTVYLSLMKEAPPWKVVS